MFLLNLSTQNHLQPTTTCPKTITSWLVVWNPPEKHESQLGWLFSIYGKIKNVPSHQPVMDFLVFSMVHSVPKPSTSTSVKGLQEPLELGGFGCSIFHQAWDAEPWPSVLRRQQLKGQPPNVGVIKHGWKIHYEWMVYDGKSSENHKISYFYGPFPAMFDETGGYARPVEGKIQAKYGLKYGTNVPPF